MSRPKKPRRDRPGTERGLKIKRAFRDRHLDGSGGEDSGQSPVALGPKNPGESLTPLAHRLNKELPCAQAGMCVDCSSPLRICCYVSIIEWQRETSEKDRLNLFIVGEELGL